MFELNASEADIRGSLLLSQLTDVSDHAVARTLQNNKHVGSRFRAHKLIDLSLANVTGDVVLSGADIGCSLDGSHAGTLAEGCALMAGGLKANALWIDSSSVNGRVFLAGAELKTMLSIRETDIELPIDNSQLTAEPNSKGRASHPDLLLGKPEFRFVALAANDMTLGTKLYIQNCRVLGQVRLSRAKIGGDCLFESSLFCSPYVALRNQLEGVGIQDPEQSVMQYLTTMGIDDDSHHMASLHASRADIGGGVFLNLATSCGELRFRNTRIRGVLNARGALLISLRSIQLSQVDFDQIKPPNGQSVSGLLHAGASQLETSKKRLVSSQLDKLLSGIALCADRADINSSVFFGRQDVHDSIDRRILFRSYGEVSMRQTRIGGSLSCRHAQMVAAALPIAGRTAELGVNEIGQKHFVALALSGSEVGGTLFLSGDTGTQCFRSEGEIRLRGAKIKGNIIFHNGRFLHVPIETYAPRKHLLESFMRVAQS